MEIERGRLAGIGNELYTDIQTNNKGINDLTRTSTMRDRLKPVTDFSSSDIGPKLVNLKGTNIYSFKSTSEPRFLQRQGYKLDQKRISLKQKVMASATALGLIVALGAGINSVTANQMASMENANAVVYSETLPLEMTDGLTYEFNLKADGTVFFTDTEGNHLDSVMGIYADEYAEQLGYEVPEQAKKSNRI